MNVKEQIANEIHKPARKRFSRRKVIVKGLDDLWQCDLIDMIKYNKFNKGYKYLLTVIDVFSKFAWARPIKDKSAKAVTNAMKEILMSGRKPNNLQSDLGSEFYNKYFKELINKYSINHYSTYSSLKASVVERFNRTLKNLMWKKFTINGSYNWKDMLQQLIKTYNNKRHSTIKIKPCEVNKNNEQHILQNIYKYKKSLSTKGAKFDVDDYVRISKYKSEFSKGYTPNYSTEIFKIYKVVQTEPVTYLLNDVDGKPILGGFYQEELVKVKYPDIYLVEKIVKRKNDKVYVKWLGFPSSKNSWISKDSIV